MTDLTPPQKTRNHEVAEWVGEAVLSQIPLVGGAIAASWDRVIGRAFEKRRRAWEQSVVDGLEAVGARIDDLEDDPTFLDAFANALVAATMTSEEEKLDALRNAVLNSAVGIDIDGDTKTIFLRHLRDFTPSHLQLLALLQDPPRWFADHGIEWPTNIMMGGLGQNVVEVGIPEVAGQQERYSRIYADLAAAGFTNTGGLNVTMSASGLAAKRTTSLGDAFLRFITDPRDSDQERG